VALGLASVSIASAQTQYVYYTGSTAARDAVYNTIMNGSTVFDHQPEFVGYGSSTPGNCSWMAFSNTISGNPTIIKCDWSGSEAGIADVGTVSGPLQELFMNDPGTGTIPAFSSTPNGIATPSAPASGNTNLATVDIAQADNSISYSHIPGAVCVEYNDSLVIPFTFVKNTTTIADAGLVNNVTDDQFYQLANGGDKMALFTGNNAESKYVYLTGRDNNSGTRVNTFGDTGYGISKLPNQIELSSGAMVNFGGATPYYTVQGQSSGGTLAKSLTDTTSSTDPIKGGTGFMVITYLGLSDNNTATNTPYNAVDISFNGVPYSNPNIENGTYALWGYEFTEVNPNDDGSGDASDTVAQAVIAGLPSNTSGYEIPTGSMHAKRSGPTGHPYHL
jgi:hypothetical protein